MRKISLIAFISSLLFSVSAHGYIVLFDQYGNYRSWGKSTVKWALAGSGSDDLSNSQIQGALQAAFDNWQNVTCSKLKFTFSGIVSANPNKDIFIRWMENSWFPEAADAAGVTTNWSIGQNGPKKVEIFFNGVSFKWVIEGADDPFSNAVDVQAVATHEIGHAIGLDHPRHRFATMFFSMFPGQSEEQRSLEPDDKRGVCFLYPNSNFTDGQPCDACANNNQCKNGVCLNYGGSEGAYCSQECSQNTPCPEGFSCFNVTGVNTPQCIADNEHCAPIGGNVAIGDYCYDHPTCASGRCMPLPDSAVCTKDCVPNGPGNGGCPSTMVCLGKNNKGICYPKGDGQLGDSCKSPADCAVLYCVGIGSGKGICTQGCTTTAQCPAGFSCSAGYCIKPGTKPFGDTCETLLDCASAYCHPIGKYCTQACNTDNDCPEASKCSESGYCGLGPTGNLGDTCGKDAKECKPDFFCLYTEKGAPTGTCVYKCDARFDSGCPGDMYCQWVYQEWLAKVVGVCQPPNGGGSLGAPCGGSSFCLPHLVCANTDGQGAKCRQDCNAKNLLGCAGSATCVPLNLPKNPKLGACHPSDGSPAVESPQVVETGAPEPPPTRADDPAVAEPPPPGADGTDGMDANVGGTAGVGTAQPTAGGTGGVAGTVQNGSAVGGTAVQPPIQGGGQSGGCQTGSNHPGSIVLLSLVLLAIISRRRQQNV